MRLYPKKAERRERNEKNVSTKKETEKQRTRFQKKDEYEEREARTEEKTVKKEKDPFGIRTAIRGLFADGSSQEVSE